MTAEMIEPKLPFVFPDSRALNETCEYLGPLPFQSYIESAQSVAGVVHDLDNRSANWLEEVARNNPKLHIRLIVAVYPACPTRKSFLQALTELSEMIDGRIELRLLPLRAWTSYPLTALCAWNPDATNIFMVGVTPGFMLGQPNDTDINLCFEANALLTDQWRRHFDWLWLAKAVPLNGTSALIPSLVPAEGTEEAARMWREYLRKCEEQRRANGSTIVKVEMDENTGEVKGIDQNGEPVDPPSKAEDVPKLDKLAGKMTKVFAKGRLVTIDKTTRIPPLDAPVRPELLGVESFRQVGNVSRSTRFRISLLEEKTLKKINNARTKTTGILSRFSYKLADGARWIPVEAIPLFEKELERLDKDGRKQIQDAVGGDLDRLIEFKHDSIRRNMQEFYREVNPSGTVPDGSVNKVIDDLKKRFQTALEGRFLPQLSYSEVVFRVSSKDSDWGSKWGQALSLIYDAAKFPRELITDSYMMRGIHETSRDELLKAMNVFDDAIIDPEGRPPEKQAKEELARIEATFKDDGEQKQKCEDILAIIEHSGVREKSN